MSAADRLFQYIIDRAQHEELPVRISLYEDAAVVLSKETHAPVLIDLAKRLRDVERHEQQLRLVLGGRSASQIARDFNPGPL